jgi:hypothetical protein
MIEDLIDREIDTWNPGPNSIAKRMQAVTLDVIMAGIFGVEGEPAPGTPERAGDTTRRLLAFSEAGRGRCSSSLRAAGRSRAA